MAEDEKGGGSDGDSPPVLMVFHNPRGVEVARRKGVMVKGHVERTGIALRRRLREKLSF